MPCVLSPHPCLSLSDSAVVPCSLRFYLSASTSAERLLDLSLKVWPAAAAAYRHTARGQPDQICDCPCSSARGNLLNPLLVQESDHRIVAVDYVLPEDAANEAMPRELLRRRKSAEVQVGAFALHLRPVLLYVRCGANC